MIEGEGATEVVCEQRSDGAETEHMNAHEQGMQGGAGGAGGGAGGG